jgi:AcrR family transcriptional regulator
MADVKQTRRRYDSALRDQQAAATREAVLAAARDLFLAHGYGATTIEQIAECAGVSKPTVFAAVGNKQAVLAAVRTVALRGDDQPELVAEREPFQRVLTEPEPYRAVELEVEHLAELWSRYAEIKEVLRGAASSGEPALRELWTAGEQERLIAAERFINALAKKGPLRDGVTSQPPPTSRG